MRVIGIETRMLWKYMSIGTLEAPGAIPRRAHHRLHV